LVDEPAIKQTLVCVVVIAAGLAILVILLLGYLFNENSSLCILGRGGAPGASCSKDEQGGKKEEAKPGMTPEEMEIFRRLNEKKLRYDQAAEKEKTDASKQNKFADPSIVYMANLSLLQG
jgi:hypothetical protein